MDSLSQQIRSNTLRSYVWMTALTAVIGILGTLISYYFDWGLTGTGYFLAVAGVINFLGYFFSDKLILMATGAKLLKKEQAPDLFRLVEQLSNKAQIPMPKVYILNDRAMNAFATGRNHSNSAVAVSRGLVERMSMEEVEGVLAHEIAHIQNYDMRFAALVSVLVGFLSIIADMYWSSQLMSTAQEKDRSGYLAIIGTVLAIAAPLTGMFIQLAISRRREYLADASGAMLSGKPKALAGALKKIALDAHYPSHISPATAHLYFSTPNPDSFIDKAFATHPPIEERIRLLENMH